MVASISPHRLVDTAAVSVLAWSAAKAVRGDVAPDEERVFRAVNGAPDALAPLVWPVMQMGALGAVYVAAAETHRRRGRNAAVAVAVGGTAVWGGVKLVKPLIGRGRPAAHLDDVAIRGQRPGGLGYPSGHAAVSMALALAAAPRRLRPLAILAAGMTAASRMYVGAHLPLDVVGGTAIGWLVGSQIDECHGRRRPDE